MEEQLLKEAIETLKNQKRPEKIPVMVYGQYSSGYRECLYNDAEHKYSFISETPKAKTVRSVKAFVNIIREELRRRCNSTGDKATVRIHLNGGEFIPDDDFGYSLITFNRLNSQQWNVVKNGINRVYDHKGFLEFIQSLKPSFDSFDEVFRSFATLRMVGRTEITSNPIFTEEGQSSGYKCSYKLEDGCDGEETFPGGFTLSVPFAKAGDTKYSIPIDLLFFRNEDDELRIEVLCPEFENIEERAIIDESEYIKKETENLSELLILADF